MANTHQGKGKLGLEGMAIIAVLGGLGFMCFKDKLPSLPKPQDSTNQTAAVSSSASPASLDYSSNSSDSSLFTPVEDIKGVLATNNYQKAQLKEKSYETQSGDIYGWTNKVDWNGKTNKVWARIQKAVE